MTPLPPLSLVDGAFLLDNSSLEHYQTCRRLWELHDLRRYSIAANRAGRNFGTAIHAGLRVRYTHAGTGRVDNATRILMHEAVHTHFAASPQPVEDFRDAAHAVRVLDAYLDHYPIEMFKLLSVPGTDKPLIELPFSLELGTVQNIPIIWTGRIDAFIENNEGTWSFDHKTAFQFGSGFEADMGTNGGQLGYVWAMKQLSGRKPTGYRINAIRVRKPSKASKYGDGGGPAPVDATDFARLPFHVSDDDLEEWRDDVLHLIRDLFFDHDTGSFPRSRKSCSGKYGPCDMYEVCTAPRASRQQILDSPMFVPNTWSPLNKPTE